MLKKLGLGPSLSKRKRNTNNNNVRTPSTKKKKKATPLRKKVKKILSVRKSQRLKGVKVENYLKEKVLDVSTTRRFGEAKVLLSTHLPPHSPTW